jgi:serine kinase
MTPLPESTARKIFRQIVEVMTYCHSQGIAHLDLKLENILLSSSGKIFLIDFGLCEIQQTTRRPSDSFVGSIDYASPEILDRKPFDSFKADIWSLGTLLYCLVFACFPFSANARFNGTHPPLDFVLDISKPLEDLLHKMLKNDPSERCSIIDVSTHKWLHKSSMISKFFSFS